VLERSSHARAGRLPDMEKDRGWAVVGRHGRRTSLGSYAPDASTHAVRDGSARLAVRPPVSAFRRRLRPPLVSILWVANLP
jgi:hypothetical protein